MTVEKTINSKTGSSSKSYCVRGNSYTIFVEERLIKIPYTVPFAYP